MRRRTLIVAAAAATLLAAAAIALAEPMRRNETLQFISPARFRETAFERFVGAMGEEIYLLGTVAPQTTKSDQSLGRLRGVITRLRPDVVLVEMPPEEMARDNLADGPVEALYATLVSRDAGIPALGFDWRMADAEGGAEGEAREDRMFGNAHAAFAGHRKVLILVSLAHRQAFAERLRTLGFRRAPLAGADKARLLEAAGAPATYPIGMAAYLHRRIDADRAAREAAADPTRAAALDHAISTRVALLRRIWAVGEA